MKPKRLSKRLVGSICHNEDDVSNPAHRRIRLWLDSDGRMWADFDDPHLAHDDRFASIEAARVAARKAWSDPCWAYRDEQ